MKDVRLKIVFANHFFHIHGLLKFVNLICRTYKMNKWQLARYLIDAKKCIDSILFIAENIKELRNLNTRDIVDDRLRKFYINVKVLYDKSFTIHERKQLNKTDDVFRSTCLERDKNYAHKDEDYISPDFEYLKAIADVLTERLNHCFYLCRDSLPKEVTLDYIDYDHDLYRFIHKIDYEKEETLMKSQHPGYAETKGVPLGEQSITKKVFYDTEDIRKIDNPDEHTVIMKSGLTIREGIQEMQDSCIRINVLFNQNIWGSPKMEVIIKLKKMIEENPDLPFYTNLSF